jgi:cation diffusion facilitator CzcD-associated flavoprotein CzcO
MNPILRQLTPPLVDWSSLFPRGSELAEYFRQFADKFQLRSCTTFNANVLEAIWSDEKMTWTVITEDMITRQRTMWTTKILIYAPGTYNRSVTPDISGISSFKGEMWHTYNWPANVDLSGKVVAYIGSGPSAVQILPSIQPVVKSLKVYVRSMTYCLPMSNAINPPAIQFVKRWVPGLLSVYAFVLGYIFGLWSYYLFRPGSWVARSAEWYCTSFFEQEVTDPILREKLRPKGRIGDKRPLVSRSFYRVLQKPNVEVITDRVSLIDERGIVSAPVHPAPEDTSNYKIREGNSQNGSLDGISLDNLTREGVHNDVDVIIWGTGFKMQGWGTAFRVVGRQGKTLGEHWGGAPQTLYGELCGFLAVRVLELY